MPARADAAVLYTFCRRADDAIDQAAAGDGEHALAELERRVDSIYRGHAQADLAYRAFAELVRAVSLPRLYPDELLAGFAMDVRGTRYRSLDDLLLYCHRVAGVVGLMMCHVLGVDGEHALPPAAQLGIALQLTNICRDIAEDWQLGRLYLPEAVLARHGAGSLRDELGGPLPIAARAALCRTVEDLLELADRFYRSADRGLSALPYRSALAVRSARLVYSEIGHQLRRRGCDPLLGRVVVGTPRKLQLVLKGLTQSFRELPARAFRPAKYAAPERSVHFPEHILPLHP
jgi:phytoene synthase